METNKFKDIYYLICGNKQMLRYLPIHMKNLTAFYHKRFICINLSLNYINKFHQDNETYNCDVSKFVCPSHCVVVQRTGGRDPPWVCVISKHNQLVLLSLVSHKMKAVLNVRRNDTVANCMNCRHIIGNALKS